MLVEEKKTFIEKNLKDYELCHLKIHISFLDEYSGMIQNGMFDRRLKTLRTNDTFKSKGFNQILKNELWFTFKLNGTKGYMNGCCAYDHYWDADDNLDICETFTKYDVYEYDIPILFYKQLMPQGKLQYFSSFVKMVDDYFAFHISNWNTIKKTITLITPTPTCFPSAVIYYSKKQHLKSMERPITFSMRQINSKYGWIMNFIKNHNNGYELVKTNDKGWATIKVSMEMFQEIKKSLKIDTDKECETILLEENKYYDCVTGPLIARGACGFVGNYTIPVDCTTNYFYLTVK